MADPSAALPLRPTRMRPAGMTDPLAERSLRKVVSIAPSIELVDARSFAATRNSCPPRKVSTRPPAPRRTVADLCDPREGAKVRREMGLDDALSRLAVNVLTSVPFFWVCFAGLVVASVVRDVCDIVALPDQPWNGALDAIIIVVVALFLVEMAATLRVQGHRLLRTRLFWLDFIAIVSVTLESAQLVSKYANRPMLLMEADNSLLAASTWPGTWFRVMFIPALGAVRRAKLLKALGYFQVSHTNRLFSQASEEGGAGGPTQAYKNTRRMMREMALRIPLLLLALACLQPFLHSEAFLDGGSPATAWLYRLDADYAATVAEIADNRSSSRFHDTVEAFKGYCATRAMRPYSFQGFDHVVINGTVAWELDETLPVRGSYSYQDHICPAGTGRDCSSDVRRVVSFDISRFVRLEATQHLVELAALFGAMVLVTHLIRVACDATADLEKRAKLVDMYVEQRSWVDDSFADMPEEQKGFLELYGLGGGGKSGLETIVLNQRSLRSRAASTASSKHKPRLCQTLKNMDLDKRTVESWNFDVINCTDEQREAVVSYLFFDSSIGRSSDRPLIDHSTFHAFHRAVLETYLMNPYHNYKHACDACHTVYRLMCDTQAKRWMSDVEQFALLVAALCHDLGHPGRNNQFLTQTSNELAIRYNDQSPLENMHCARLFKICSDPAAQVFKMCAKDSEYRVARSVCISVILHTDMIHHADMVKRLMAVYEMHSEICHAQAQDMALLPDFEREVVGKDTTFWLELFMHYADISNPTKPFHLCRVWAQWCLAEMFEQGDEEKRLGIPVGLLNDREKVTVAGSQHGFINFVVAPLVMGAARIFHSLLPLADEMTANIEEWQAIWLEISCVSITEEEIAARSLEVRRLKDEVAHIRRGYIVQERPLALARCGTLQVYSRSSSSIRRRSM